MRKTVLLVASVALAVLLVSGVVLAAEVTCPNKAGMLCVGTPGDDTMAGTPHADDMRGEGGNDVMRAKDGNDIIRTGKGTDDVSGSNGDDSLHARGGTDELVGGFGDDTVNGGGGSDTYRFGYPGWGHDRINVDESGEDTLTFSACYVVVRLSARPERAEAFSPGWGTTLNFPATVEIENASGGTCADTIYGNAARNKLDGRHGSDVLFGLGGDDDLLGGPLDDDYHFETDNNWGNDTITDSTSSDPIDFGSGNWVTFGKGLTQDLTINLVSSSSANEVTNQKGTGTIDWDNSVIDNVVSLTANDTNDTINGNRAANEILSYSGNDTISARGGNDYIAVSDGAGDDSVDCGAGDDLLLADPGDSINDNCENQH